MASVNQLTSDDIRHYLAAMAAMARSASGLVTVRLLTSDVHEARRRMNVLRRCVNRNRSSSEPRRSVLVNENHDHGEYSCDIVTWRERQPFSRRSSRISRSIRTR